MPYSIHVFRGLFQKILYSICFLSETDRMSYRPTARNRYYLRRYRQGKSIGFTLRSSLKAKGLIPRANGTKRVSKKYQSQRR